MKNDDELVKQIKQGSAEALEELINEYYYDIFSYSCRILGSYHDALDITQDVFISMMKAIPNYQERNKFKSWIFTIAHNRCMNCIAMRKNHSDISEVKEVSTSEDFTVEQSEREYVKDMLDTLSINQKNTIILKYYHDLTFKEIGKVTNSNVSTVKSRLYQGIEKLKSIIKDGEGDEKR